MLRLVRRRLGWIELELQRVNRYRNYTAPSSDGWRIYRASLRIGLKPRLPPTTSCRYWWLRVRDYETTVPNPMLCMDLAQWTCGGDLNPRPLGYEPLETPEFRNVNGLYQPTLPAVGVVSSNNCSIKTVPVPFPCERQPYPGRFSIVA